MKSKPVIDKCQHDDCEYCGVIGFDLLKLDVPGASNYVESRYYCREHYPYNEVYNIFEQVFNKYLKQFEDDDNEVEDD